MNEEIQNFQAVVPWDMAGKRLDQAMAGLFSDFSRSRISEWIKSGHVLVDGQCRRPRDKLKGGEKLELSVPVQPEVSALPENIPLNIVFEDDSLLVIDKPAGLVVHPGAGNPRGTLQNALLFHDETLATIPRSGIVHRLDKDTTGLMVVAKTEKSHKLLVEQLQQREVVREYRALVMGAMTAGGTVDEPIGRHPTQRIRMAVHPMGKPAVTHYRINQRFRAFTYLNVKLETGRTHQIRVHLAHLRYPIVGDSVYAGRLRIPAGISDSLKQALRQFPRQALHARFLSLQHPESGEWMQWEAPVPEDMMQLLALIQHEDSV